MVRLKSRYLFMEMTFEDGKVDESLSSSTIYDEIRRSLGNTYGDYGIGCVRKSFKVKYVNPYTGIVFIKCSRDYYCMLWHAVTFVKEINGRQCSLNTLHLTGTINSCQRLLIAHNKKRLLKMLSQCKTPAEKKKISKILGQLPSAKTAAEEKKKRQGDLAWKHLTY